MRRTVTILERELSHAKALLDGARATARKRGQLLWDIRKALGSELVGRNVLLSVRNVVDEAECGNQVISELREVLGAPKGANLTAWARKLRATAGA